MPNSKPTFLAPERVYAIQYFHSVSGVSATRRREAKKDGVELLVLEIGRRKFVRGSDAIEYLERLAKLPQ